MKKRVIFSIAMLMISSAAFGANLGQGGAGQRHLLGGNGAGELNQGGGYNGGGELNQGGGHNGGGVQRMRPGQGGGTDTPGYVGGVTAPLAASDLNGALIGGNPATWTPKHIHSALAIVHEAMARLHAAMSNVSGAAMSKIHPAMTNLHLAESKLHVAMSGLKTAQSVLTPAQSKLVNDALTIIDNVQMNPLLINLFPSSEETGNGNTNTPGFVNGVKTPGFVNGVKTPGYVNGVAAPVAGGKVGPGTYTPPVFVGGVTYPGKFVHGVTYAPESNVNAGYVGGVTAPMNETNVNSGYVSGVGSPK